jgi:hypothetical protein
MDLTSESLYDAPWQIEVSDTCWRGLMARGDKDPRFVHEFELDPTPEKARILGICLDLGRQIYNAGRGEARRPGGEAALPVTTPAPRVPGWTHRRDAAI